MDRIQVKKEIGAIERKESLLEYQKWVDSEKSGILDLIVYSDGSMNEFGNAGAGYCIFRGPTFEIASGRILLGRTAEVYDAEIIGATEGLKAAMAHFMGGYTANVTVFLDNEEAALRLHTGTMTSSSSKQISEFQELKNSWPNRNRTSVASPGTVRVRWIPGHRRIVGNGKADVLGKTACGEPTSRTQASVSRGKRLLEQRYGANIDDFWNKKAPERYKYLGIRMTGTMLDKLKFLSPKSLGSLLAARSAHGDFAAYHRRFKYEEAALMCESGEEKSPEHPFSCRRLSRRGKPQSKPSRGVVGDIR